MWLRDKPEHYIRNSTDSHHIRTLCQIIFWSCLIHFLGTVSTNYFSILLAITEKIPYLSMIDTWLLSVLLPGLFLVSITILLQTSLSIHIRRTTVTSRDKKITNWNTTWYIWVGKTLGILDSSIMYMYDIDKTQNIILKIPLFHIPASHFWRNRHDTMGKIAE